jgi:endonuclease G
MKKFIFFLALMLTPFAVFAAEPIAPKPVESCKIQTPYGLPGGKNGHPIVCHTGFILQSNLDGKIPDWVAWTLTPEHVIGCTPRVDAFAPDQALPKGQRAELVDYDHSGYDQGHLANNADLSWDATAARESFLLSNMSPQLPSLNRGTWKNLEQAERAWVYSTNSPYTIYAGNVFSEKSKRIGPNKVAVPDYLYKILVDNNTKKAYAFLFPHKDGLDSDFTLYQTTIMDVEVVSGNTFPVPDVKTAKNNLPALDLKAYADKKKAICK